MSRLPLQVEGIGTVEVWTCDDFTGHLGRNAFAAPPLQAPKNKAGGSLLEGAWRGAHQRPASTTAPRVASAWESRWGKGFVPCGNPLATASDEVTMGLREPHGVAPVFRGDP